jgi:hypothetical protein
MTDEDKVKIYEAFLHNLDMLLLVGNSDKIKEKLGLVSAWSYAHRQGNGELTEAEQRSLVDSALKKLK